MTDSKPPFLKAPAWTPAIRGYQYPIERITKETHPNGDDAYLYYVDGLSYDFSLRAFVQQRTVLTKYWVLTWTLQTTNLFGDLLTVETGSLEKCCIVYETHTTQSPKHRLKLGLVVRKLELEAHKMGWSLDTNQVKDALTKGDYIFYKTPVHTETPP